jgi:2-C-methyl-D-erythritol 4-phosphate cytidylyltransferase/2-C-methyl-D-erythritol 2,4-cyclodiphosphate synthase
MAVPEVGEIVVALPEAPGPGEEEAIAALPPMVKTVRGGPRRVDSSRLGFLATSPSAKVVLVHDAARPLARPVDIDNVRLAARESGAAVLAVPVSDTLKLAGSDGMVEKTVPREGLWRALTPQGFRREILERAFSEAGERDFTAASSMVEARGHKVRLVAGSPDNIKITPQSVLSMARRLAGEGTRFRVGQGWDFHRFDPTRPLWLGCVRVPMEPGLLGHSDADVLAHALVDALLGAAGLGDIGAFFPSDDPKWEGIPGAHLLGRTMELVRGANYRLINADLNLIGERPRISKYRERMREALAKAVGLSPNFLNLKGKTTEGMGFLGRGEGLGASATLLLAQEG